MLGLTEGNCSFIEGTARLGNVDGQEGGHGGGEQLVQRRVHDELVAQLEQERRVALADAADLRSGSGFKAMGAGLTYTGSWLDCPSDKPMYTAHHSAAQSQRGTGCESVPLLGHDAPALSARQLSVRSITAGADASASGCRNAGRQRAP